jgi:hypothetical protein
MDAIKILRRTTLGAPLLFCKVCFENVRLSAFGLLLILLGRLLKPVGDRLTRNQLRGGAVSLHRTRNDFRTAARGKKTNQT